MKFFHRVEEGGLLRTGINIMRVRGSKGCAVYFVSNYFDCYFCVGYIGRWYFSAAWGQHWWVH